MPDILFNAHGIPSRMTMGQMWDPGGSRAIGPGGEQVIAKLAALLGNDSKVSTYGAPFTHVDRLRSVCMQLHDAGYPGFGREPMYSGITGERLDGDVNGVRNARPPAPFIGMVHYQRLRHMVQILVRACVHVQAPTSFMLERSARSTS